MRRFIFAALFFLTATPTFAQTGNDLHQKCGNGFTAGMLNRAYCHSYILGITNGLATSGSGIVCPTNGVTDTQAVMIVQNYMRAHPEELNKPATDIIREAMAEAFPCSIIQTPLQTQNSTSSTDTPALTPTNASNWLIGVGTLLLGVAALLFAVRAVFGRSRSGPASSNGEAGETSARGAASAAPGTPATPHEATARPGAGDRLP